MQIMVNNQPLALEEATTLQQLLQQINQPEKGVALAVNQQIISRSKWSERCIQPGDQITLIKATAGG